MEEVVIDKPKVRERKKDGFARLFLKDETHRKVQQWVEQLTPRMRGSKITTHTVVDWLLNQHADCLSEAELSAMEQQFYDPVKLLQWAAKEIKAAKARGEKVDVEGFLSSSMKLKSPVKKQSKNKSPGQIGKPSTSQSNQIENK